MASPIRSLILAAILGVVTVYATAPFIITSEPEDQPIRTEKVENPELYRLDRNEFYPLKYMITINLAEDFHTSKVFKGKVIINIKSDKTPDKQSIFLNAVGLTDIKYTVKNGANVIPTNAKPLEPVYETQEIVFDAKPTATEYVIEAEYTGKLYEDMRGFYISNYRKDETETYVLATQFQPTHARKLMPCFDEPKYKAVFELTIIHPKEYGALSNTQVATPPTPPTPGAEDMLSTKFKPTPIMSTYLLAITVSKFTEVTETTIPTKHSVWSRFNGNELSKFALEKSPEVIYAMEKFTSLLYRDTGIGKIDHIALPDFSAGAMENWGLVTYREAALLYDPEESTTKSKQQITTVIAHELAHFWCGNLATTEWWDHTWLNEGFATYFEYMAAAKVEPTWELDKQFVVERHFGIMNTDSQRTTEPINSKCDSPDEIRGKFDPITYNKGASLVRMLRHLAKREMDFYDGIYAYLSKDKTVTPAKLWAALDSKVVLPNDVTLSTIMETYVTQPGLPVINVALNNKEVTLKQQRFGFEKEPPNGFNKWYYIPISYTTGINPNFEDTKPKKWLKNTADATTSITLENDEMVIVNLQSTAYARVNYNAVLWNRIKTALAQNNFGGIHVLNRAQIVDDALNLALAGLLEYGDALDIVKYLVKERSYYPWYAAHSAFRYLLQRFPAGTPEAEQLKRFILHLTKDVYENDLNDESTHIKALKKALIRNWRCALDDHNCVEQMVALFKLWKNENTKIPADLRSTAYCTALRKSEDPTDWDKLFVRFKTTSLPSEASLIIPALGCTQSDDKLKAYLDETLIKDGAIRAQDVESVFSSVISGGPRGIQVAITFLKTKYETDEMKNRYGGQKGITAIVIKLINRFNTQAEVDTFTTFLNEKEHYFKEEAKKTLELVKISLKWTQDNKAKISAFLTEFFKPGAGAPPPGGDDDDDEDEPGSAGSIAVSILLLVCNLCIVIYSRL